MSTTVMETLALPSDSPRSLSASPRNPSPTDSSMNTNTKLRDRAPRVQLDPFPAASTFLPDSSPRYSPGDKLDAPDSPRTLPLSFRNLSSHENETSTTTSHQARSYGSPSLVIRKMSNASSINRDISHTSLNQLVGSPGTRSHRRSAEFSLSPAKPKSSDNSFPEKQRKGSNDSYTSDFSSSEQFARRGSDEQFAFPGLEIEEENDEVCTRHHHRQSISSTVSISCSERDDETEEPIEYEESAISMEPMAPSMLVPLVDRADEMKDLLDHPANAAWATLARNIVGDKTYETECIPLWTKTERSEMSDAEWLNRSQRLLSRQSCGGIMDGKLWADFCGMVGWDAGAPLPELDRDLRRKSSRDSIGSSSSVKMSMIAEEEEESGEHHGRTDEGEDFTAHHK